MPLVVITCEHCGEEANLFLRQSQLGRPVECPACGKEMKGDVQEADDAAPPPAGKGVT